MAAELVEPVLSLVEGLKQCSPNLRSPLRFSATPEGGKTEKNKRGLLHHKKKTLAELHVFRYG